MLTFLVPATQRHDATLARVCVTSKPPTTPAPVAPCERPAAGALLPRMVGERCRNVNKWIGEVQYPSYRTPVLHLDPESEEWDDVLKKSVSR